MSNPTNPTKQSVKQLCDKALQAALDAEEAISIAESRREELKSNLTSLNREQQELEKPLQISLALKMTWKVLNRTGQPVSQEVHKSILLIIWQGAMLWSKSLTPREEI